MFLLKCSSQFLICHLPSSFYERNNVPTDPEGKSAADIHRELEEVNTKADLLRARAERVRGMIDGGDVMDRQRGAEKVSVTEKVPRLDLAIKVNKEEERPRESHVVKEKVAKKLDYSFHSDTG